MTWFFRLTAHRIISATYLPILDPVGRLRKKEVMRRARTLLSFTSVGVGIRGREIGVRFDPIARRYVSTCDVRRPRCSVAESMRSERSVRDEGYAVREGGVKELKKENAERDTIFAISSGHADVVCGVTVVRVSGENAHWAISRLLAPGAGLPSIRRASLRKLFDPKSGLPLDEALVILFQQPYSFTGEDVAEIHVHGSRAVVRGTVAALCDMEGLRAASRGEFSRRAFENGRMDLTAVEGLGDLLGAETEMQRVQALRAVGGGAREVFEGWRIGIRDCLAHVEAVIDFGDDVDDEAFQDVVPKARGLCEAIVQRMRRDGRIGEIVRDGVRVAIIGEPNVGKSSLINALAKRDLAIVTDIPGTTRDVLSTEVEVNGLRVVLADTAGIREGTEDRVEIEGMRRARKVAEEADITIVMRDVRDVLGKVDEGVRGDMGRCIRIANKIDLVDEGRLRDIPEQYLKLCLTEQSMEFGLGQVLRVLEDTVVECIGKDSMDKEMPVVTRARHRYHLNRAVVALNGFVEGRSGSKDVWLPMDIAAEELRIACRELGAITGVVHVEEVLDVIFRDFCIGK